MQGNSTQLVPPAIIIWLKMQHYIYYALISAQSQSEFGNIQLDLTSALIQNAGLAEHLTVLKKLRTDRSQRSRSHHVLEHSTAVSSVENVNFESFYVTLRTHKLRSAAQDIALLR